MNISHNYVVKKGTNSTYSADPSSFTNDMNLLPRCNNKTYPIVASATFLMSCRKIYTMDEYITHLWLKQYARFADSAVPNPGCNVTLQLICDVETFTIVIGITFLMSCSKCSITDAYLTSVMLVTVEFLT